MADPGQDKPHDGVGHRIVRAMFVIIFFQLFWKFGGLIVTLLVGSIFGSGPESDAYFFVTETVVFLLQTLCLKVFIPVVVPLFKQELSRQGEEAAWRFGSTVLNLAALVLAAIVVGAFIFAPRILSLFAMGFNEQQLALSSRLMRWMLPGVFGVCLATVTYALLNSYNIFGYAAAGDGVQKIAWAAVIFAASFLGLALPRMLDALAVGFVLSAGAAVLTHLLGLRSKLGLYRLGLPGLSLRRVGIELGILIAHAAALGAGLWVCERVRPSLPNAGSLLALQQAVLVVVVAAYLLLLWWRARTRGTAMAKFAALAVPLLFGILFAKYRDIVTNLFASFTGTGVFSDLKYARKVGEAPNTLVIAALSIALLPHLSELAAAKLWGEFAHVMTKTIRVIIAFFVPLTALMIVLRQPIIALLFDRGNWTDYHLSHAGDALGLYILALPFFALENPIQQSFFAMQRMWAPTIIGFLGTGFHILFLFIGIEWLGYGYFIVVAIVYCAARAFKNVILLLVMRMHVRILPWRPTLTFLAKAAIVTAGVWAAADAAYRPLKRSLPLDPYRQHEVMIDTFNVELRDWEADNVDDFRIVSRADKDDAALLKEAFGAADVVDGQNALMARYRRSPRRAAGLRYDLSALDITNVSHIELEAACPAGAELEFALETRDVQFLPHTERHSVRAQRHRFVVELHALGPTDPQHPAVALWIRDVTQVAKATGERTTLLVDNLTFYKGHRGQTTGRPALIEGFEPASLWQAEAARVEDTQERKGAPEYALHLLPQPADRAAVRDIRHHAFRRCNALRFKARAGQPATLTVGLAPDAESAPVCEAAVQVAATQNRKSYAVPLSAFKGNGTPDLSQVNAISVRVPAGADVWLDNVAFVREAKGPRLGRVALFYELGKLIHVTVPSLAALAAFIFLLFVLRVEEAGEAWEWLREKALKRIARKFRRKKA